jgi:SAM-dependent methyltransferase
MNSKAFSGSAVDSQSATILETVSCNLCGADNARPLFQGRDRLHHLPGEFQMVQCRQCGLIYLNPRPRLDRMSQYYPEDYPSHVAVAQPARNPLVQWEARHSLSKRLKAVAAFQPPGQLLDVGCATGVFLSFAREKGWDVQGIEVSDRTAAFCRDELGLQVASGDLLDASFPPNSFDVVTLWSVFEHLHDPMSTLSEIQHILRPGGLLVLAVPNAESLDARLFGPAWVGYDMPRHLYITPRDVLQRMLAHTGFEILRHRCFFGSRVLFFFSLRYYSQDRVGWQRFAPLLARLERSALVRLLIVPYFWVIEVLGRGPVVTVFARKAGER